MDKVALLAELKALANDPPDFNAYSPTSRLYLGWLAKAHALISLHNRLEAMILTMATENLYSPVGRNRPVSQILSIIHRAIADLEILTPSQSNQVFGPGAVYDFLKALRELLSSANHAIFVIDPYLDDQVFDSYLSPVSTNVRVRLLATRNATSLKSSLVKFVTQKQMSVEIRISQQIHDRVVFLDGRSCWVLGQSIKDAAKSRPTYLAPLSPDAVSLKLDCYEQAWTTATAL